MNWFFYGLVNSFKFEGRASRQEFWMFTLVSWVLFFGTSWGRQHLPVFGPLVYWLCALGTLSASLAVAFRRLHDTNRSGWWVVVPYLIIVGTLLQIGISDPRSEGAAIGYGLVGLLGGLAFVAMYVVLIVFWAQTGSAGSNKYGELPPMKPDDEPAAERLTPYIS